MCGKLLNLIYACRKSLKSLKLSTNFQYIKIMFYLQHSVRRNVSSTVLIKLSLNETNPESLVNKSYNFVKFILSLPFMLLHNQNYLN